MSEYEEWLITVDKSYWVGDGHAIVKKQPIVRCRDCKHSAEGYWCRRFGKHGLRKHGGLVSVAPDGFCAWGERREP